MSDSDLLTKKLNEQVEFHQNGKRRTASKFELMIRGYAASGLKGDVTAIAWLFRSFWKSEELGPDKLLMILSKEDKDA